ncbi:hypothetical protein [Flaviflexus huanghaiensis]|uniref:hypothetical protein n=1 Tax=Flaviflexus huanghaiensis TaxID=1111473 RepID=UPI0015FBD65D|nr:hypothetical protein [Flaviflexus huanghaiensis]
MHTRDRILAGIIALILLVTTIDMAGETPIVAVGAGVMTFIALRMAFTGRCTSGMTQSCARPEPVVDQHDVVAAEPAAGKD